MAPDTCAKTQGVHHDSPVWHLQVLFRPNTVFEVNSTLYSASEIGQFYSGIDNIAMSEVTFSTANPSPPAPCGNLLDVSNPYGPSPKFGQADTWKLPPGAPDIGRSCSVVLWNWEFQVPRVCGGALLHGGMVGVVCGVWCTAVPCRAGRGGAGRCVAVCRRRCYQKAMAGMSTHGYR